MSRRPATFRQSDLTRAVKAVKAAGVDDARIEFHNDNNGKVVVIIGRGAGDKGQASDLDAWMEKHASAA